MKTYRGVVVQFRRFLKSAQHHSPAALNLGKGLPVSMGKGKFADFGIGLGDLDSRKISYSARN
jgi:hypothetical protein